MKKRVSLVALVLTVSLLLTACGSGAAQVTQAPTPTTQSAEIPTAAAASTFTFNVGEVTDLGGLVDKSNNASAWQGLTEAASQFGIGGKYLESQSPSDYPKNIQQFLDDKYNLIITVGYQLGLDTAAAAKANPNINFAIVDYSYPDCSSGLVEGKGCGSSTVIPNVRSLIFQTDEGAFLAGYLAAGMTRSGVVGTFGGLNIPSVTLSMKGFEAGVKYYNQQKGTSVQVLGWNTARNEGLFTGNFASTDDGRTFANLLLLKGVDVIMPVAQSVGLGSAAVCKETGKCWIVGEDSDWYVRAPEYKEVILTSVLKKVNLAVFDAVKAALDGNFIGGTVTYTIKNGGVDLAPFHDLDSRVPAGLKAELDAAKGSLIGGFITVDGILSK